MENKKEKKYKEVVINTCYGGFGLSDEAYEELIKLGIPVKKYVPEEDDVKTEPIIFDNELIPRGEHEWHDKLYWDLKKKESNFLGQRYWDFYFKNHRENPLLLKVVKKLGKKANTPYSNLKIVKIPADVKYEIEEYDGSEWVAEKHRVWR
jgi:hypothetical protein